MYQMRFKLKKTLVYILPLIFLVETSRASQTAHNLIFCFDTITEKLFKKDCRCLDISEYDEIMTDVVRKIKEDSGLTPLDVFHLIKFGLSNFKRTRDEIAKKIFKKLIKKNYFYQKMFISYFEFILEFSKLADEHKIELQNVVQSSKYFEIEPMRDLIKKNYPKMSCIFEDSFQFFLELCSKKLDISVESDYVEYLKIFRPSKSSKEEIFVHLDIFNLHLLKMFKDLAIKPVFGINKETAEKILTIMKSFGCSRLSIIIPQNLFKRFLIDPNTATNYILLLHELTSSECQRILLSYEHFELQIKPRVRNNTKEYYGDEFQERSFENYLNKFCFLLQFRDRIDEKIENIFTKSNHSFKNEIEQVFVHLKLLFHQISIKYPRNVENQIISVNTIKPISSEGSQEVILRESQDTDTDRSICPSYNICWKYNNVYHILAYRLDKRDFSFQYASKYMMGYIYYDFINICAFDEIEHSNIDLYLVNECFTTELDKKYCKKEKNITISAEQPCMSLFGQIVVQGQQNFTKKEKEIEKYVEIYIEIRNKKSYQRISNGNLVFNFGCTTDFDILYLKRCEISLEDEQENIQTDENLEKNLRRSIEWNDCLIKNSLKICPSIKIIHLVDLSGDANIEISPYVDLLKIKCKKDAKLVFKFREMELTSLESTELEPNESYTNDLTYSSIEKKLYIRNLLFMTSLSFNLHKFTINLANCSFQSKSYDFDSHSTSKRPRIEPNFVCFDLLELKKLEISHCVGVFKVKNLEEFRSLHFFIREDGQFTYKNKKCEFVNLYLYDEENQTINPCPYTGNFEYFRKVFMNFQQNRI